VKDTRPVNLDLTTFKWPLAAITSGLHRASGIFIFAGVAFLLYLLDLSLQSEAGFTRVLAVLDLFLVKLLAWAVLAGLLYHLIAGVKHLIMDLGYGESKRGATLGAGLVLLLSAVAIIVAGIWIW
jgi:succinate dehydrogenase / fumarate reductase cytochrome b subunit